MSREKQIVEEMANDIDKSHWKIEQDFTGCHINSDKIAEYLIKQGWRKPSEGEWERTEEPMGWYDVDCVRCSVCGESWVLDEDFDFDAVKDFWSFCPNCGAKMKGGADVGSKD